MGRRARRQAGEDSVEQTRRFDAAETPAPPQSAAQWAEALRRQRLALAAGERDALQRDYAALMPHFRQLLRKTKEVVGHTRRQPAASAGLSDVVQRALELSKLLYDELNRPEAPAEQAFAPSSVLQHLLDYNFEIVDRVQVQFRRLALAADYAAELHQFVSALIRGGGSQFELVPFSDLHPLVERIASDVADETAAEMQQLLPSLAVGGLTQVYEDSLLAQVYATGIATSQTVARVARTMWLREEFIEQLTSAALLQDCGCLILNPEMVPPRRAA
jgi:hypothetical protein